MVLFFLFLLLGGAGLYFGAEWLVAGASRLARSLGVPSLVVGLTIVSYGTSAPELAVCLVAATDGKSDIALGNVIGSNIANIALILGMVALIAPPRVDASLARRELPLLLLASAVVPLTLYDGAIARLEGFALLVASIAFTIATFRWTRDSAPESEILTHASSKPLLFGLIAAGLVALIAGGELFVRGTVGLARQVGMSERLVGLTVVAIGTSLPELAASLVAAVRGHSELAVGNIVGSNLFNILLVLGSTALVRPISGDLATYGVDLAVMGALTVFCAVSMRKARSIGRPEGSLYAMAYVGYLVCLSVLQ